MAETGYRLRIRFKKGGRLRFLSHLEVTRACERAIRRAGLPYAVTQGFSPRMRIAFGPALPVGTSGDREYLDLWLTAYEPAEEVRDRLERSVVAELSPRQARYVSERAPSLSSAIVVAKYEVESEDVDADTLKEGLRRLQDAGTLEVEHKGKTKTFDLGEALAERVLVEGAGAGARAELTIRIGPEGSLRPEALVSRALPAGARVASIRRTALLMEGPKGLRDPLEA